jgi:hypothetical protein
MTHQYLGRAQQMVSSPSGNKIPTACSFLRRKFFYKGWKIIPRFSDAEGSLPCSQQLAAGYYPNTDESRTRFPSYSFNIYCNMVLQARPVPRGLFPSVYPCFSYVLHILPILSLPNSCEAIQRTTLLTTQYPPPSRYFFPLRPKYLPQHLILKHPQLVVSRPGDVIVSALLGLHTINWTVLYRPNWILSP